MRYDFSAHFLKVQLPDTKFSEAWESLCLELLRAEFKNEQFLRPGPPDRGIDIFSRPKKSAYQCKSSIHGALGTIPAAESVSSLQTAAKHRGSFDWSEYAFATNARYSGTSIEKIFSQALALGLKEGELSFLDADHWDELAVKHESLIEDRFDYRVTASEKRMIEALQQHPELSDIITALETLRAAAGGVRATLENDLTKLTLEMTLPKELSGKDLLALARALLHLPTGSIYIRDLDASTEVDWLLLAADEVISGDSRLDDLQITSSDTIKMRSKLFTVRGEIEGSSDATVTFADVDRSTLAETLHSGKARAVSIEKQAEEVVKSLIQVRIWMVAHNLVTESSERLWAAA